MNVLLGMEGTKSNGNGEEKDDNMNMVETIRNLKKYVKSHKYDNERLMKAKEKQEYFNMKLMKILDNN
jgi:50S ribosomal subunit-associated GTPase HflX